MTTALSTAAVLLAGSLPSGRAKFGTGKRHGTEERTGIILLAADTFLIRHTVFGGLYQILSRSYDTNHRENTERNGQITPIGIVKRSVDLMNHTPGNIITATATTAARILVLVYLAVQNNGIHHLYNRPLIGMPFASFGRKIPKINLDFPLAIYENTPNDLSQISVCNILKG